MESTTRQVNRVCADYRTGELTGWYDGDRKTGHALGRFDTAHTPATLVNWILLHVAQGAEVEIVGKDGKALIP